MEFMGQSTPVPSCLGPLLVLVDGRLWAGAVLLAWQGAACQSDRGHNAEFVDRKSHTMILGTPALRRGLYPILNSIR